MGSMMVRHLAHDQRQPIFLPGTLNHSLSRQSKDCELGISRALIASLSAKTTGI
jgi:hypothetical protein